MLLASLNAWDAGLDDRIHVLEGDLLAPVPGDLDLVVANLPYLPYDERPLHPDLDAEPPAAVYAAGDRRPIAGVGQAIGDKIVELATTGHMAAYERLHAEIPASLVDLLRIPGVGPQTVRIVYEGLGVESLEDLRQAAEAGTLRGLKGISASTEQRILEGIEQLESRPQRLLLDRAQATSDDLVRMLDGTLVQTIADFTYSTRQRRAG